MQRAAHLAHGTRLEDQLVQRAILNSRKASLMTRKLGEFNGCVHLMVPRLASLVSGLCRGSLFRCWHYLSEGSNDKRPLAFPGARFHSRDGDLLHHSPKRLSFYHAAFSHITVRHFEPPRSQSLREPPLPVISKMQYA